MTPSRATFSWPLLLAAALRLAAWLVVSPTRFASDEDSYFLAASSLIARGQQDLFWPPVTGWLIAWGRWITGSDQLPALRLIWIGLDLAAVVAIGILAARVGRMLFVDDETRVRRLSSIAMYGYALYLPAISHAQFLTSETPAVLLTLLCLVLLSSPEPVSGTFAAAGTLAGVLVLARPNTLPLLLAWPIAMVAGGFDRRRIAAMPVTIGQIMVFVLMSMLVVGAWVARNWTVSGQMVISNNAAYNLYIGNRDLYAEDLDLFTPAATQEQIEFRRQQWTGQLVYPSDAPSELQRQAVSWILQHPWTFARRALGRLARVFAPKTDVLELAGGEQAAGIFSPLSLLLLAVANLQWVLWLVGGGLGLAALWHLTPPLGRLFAATITGAVLLCLVAIAKPRYTFVFDPLFLIGLSSLLVAPRESMAAMTDGTRRLLIGLGLFLAWGWTAWLIFAITSRWTA